jgi:WD40 repeat protein
MISCDFTDADITMCNFEHSHFEDIKKMSEITLRNHKDFVETVAFSPCGKIFASGGNEKIILIWKVETL